MWHFNWMNTVDPDSVGVHRIEILDYCLCNHSKASNDTQFALCKELWNVHHGSIKFKTIDLNFSPLVCSFISVTREARKFITLWHDDRHGTILSVYDLFTTFITDRVCLNSFTTSSTKALPTSVRDDDAFSDEQTCSVGTRYTLVFTTIFTGALLSIWQWLSLLYDIIPQQEAMYCNKFTSFASLGRFCWHRIPSGQKKNLNTFTISCLSTPATA